MGMRTVLGMGMDMGLGRGISEFFALFQVSQMTVLVALYDTTNAINYSL